jgi:ribose/xylose/arabinose/galactoside ABC-type transport system permease subunit
MVSLLGVQPIIATLILFISGRGVAQVLTNGNLQTFSNPGFDFLGTGRVLGLPFQGWLALALALGFALLVGRTIFGRHLLATGGNPRAAELAGVPVRAVTISVYVVSAVLAGLAGLIVVAINSASDAARNGYLMELDAIAAAVVGGAVLSGGRAPVLGALLGAVFIQLVRYTLLANGLADAVALIVKAAIIVAAVSLQGSRSA